MLVLDQYVFSQKRKRKWCENHVSWFKDFLVSMLYACIHTRMHTVCLRSILVGKRNLAFGSQSKMLAEWSVSKEGGLRCWYRNCIMSQKASQSYGGRGLSLVLTRLGIAERTGWRDGWSRKKRRRRRRGWGLHRLSLMTHTCTSSSLSWCPSSLDPPPLSGSLTPAHLLGAVQWGGGFSVPSPTTCTLNHVHSASNSLTHTAAYHGWLLTTLCCVLEPWCKIYKCVWR